MTKQKRERSLTDNEAKAVARMLRVSPQKLNLVAQMIRGRKASAAPADHQFSSKGDVKQVLAGPTVMKIGSSRSRKGKRQHLNTQQVTDGLQIVNTYKKAGYGISGVTRDGVIIVKPSGKPDSFNLIQLDRALSEVGSKS